MRAKHMKGPDRRDQILDAAGSTFARMGYQKASIAAICKEAGIARGTLYQYFRDKHDLFRAVLRSYLDRLRQYMVPLELTPGEFERINLDEVRRFLDLRLRLIFHAVNQDSRMFKVFFLDATSLQTDSWDLVEELDRGFVNLISTELATMMNAGLVNRTEPSVAANLIFGGLMKICFDLVVMREPGDLDRLAADATEFLLKGLVGALPARGAGAAGTAGTEPAS